MLGYLKGHLLDHTPGSWLVGVGSEEMGFVGYQVSVPGQPAYELASKDALVELFLYTHVREDVLDLFGFKTRIEKDLFITLLSVNKIGPKSALSVLSAVGVDALIESIINGDQERLTKVPGVGKKTAERLVVELRDTIKKKFESGALTSLGSGLSPDQASALVNSRRAGTSYFGNEQFKDAFEALKGLGVKEGEASQVLQKLIRDHPETEGWQTPQIIRSALMEFGQRQ